MLRSSIINERKNHANFQLIIITHDESFLRKLGQSNVMEYYWYAPASLPRMPPLMRRVQARLSRCPTEVHY